MLFLVSSKLIVMLIVDFYDIGCHLRLRSVKTTSVSPKKINVEREKKCRTVANRHSKLERCESVSIEDIVLFKMRGFCAWPARVIKIVGRKAEIQFFGDNTTQSSDIEKNFYKFETSVDHILSLLRNRKNPLYGKAIREAEIALGIPMELSVLNKV